MDRGPSKHSVTQNMSNNDREISSANDANNALMEETSDNPYCFPEFALRINVKYNGETIRFPGNFKENLLTTIMEIHALPMRADDVMLLTFPKNGTHWMSEILTMLVNGNINYAKTTKSRNMLEAVKDLSKLADLPSPRVLNSHIYHVHLPQEVLTKKIKIVHIIRNPKDVVVSMWHHIRQLASPKFSFDNFLKGYTQGGYTAMSHQFNYLRQMEKFERANPDHPIKHIHYEDLKQDPVSVIKDVAEFLDVPATNPFCQDVAQACSFDRLKVADECRKNKEDLSATLSLYRKGIVGDWKNQFTVAQNEAFDEFIRSEMKSGLKFTFRGLSIPI